MPLVVCAQNNIEELQAKLEQIRSFKGETSQEYLDALNEIVQIFGNQEASADQLKIAFDYRLQHTTIIATLKGENSVEYAEDLFRLGNTQRRLGNSNDALSYFIKAIEIFEKQQCLDSEFFELSAYMASLILRQQQQYENAIPFQEKCVKSTHLRYGAKDIRHIDTCDLLLRLAGKTKKWDIIKQYSRQVLDNIGTLTKENFQYYSYATLGEHIWLWVEKRYNEAIEVYLQYLEKVKRDIGENSIEYVEGLKSLTTDYWLVGRYSNAVAVGENAVKIMTSLYNNDKSLLFNNTTYKDVCNTLYNVYGIIADKPNEYKYNRILLDILKSENSTNSDDYRQKLIDVFESAVDIGEYKYALTISKEVESLIPKYSACPDKDLYHFVEHMIDICSNLEMYNKSLEYSQKRLNLLPKIIKDNDLLNLQITKIYSWQSGLFKTHLNDKTQASNTLLLAEEAFNKIQNKDNDAVRYMEANILAQKADVEEDFNKSISIYSKALEIYTKLEEGLKTRITSSKETGNKIVDISAEQLELKYALQDVCGSISTLLTNRGVQYLGKGLYDLAYADFVKAAKIVHTIKSPNSSDYILVQNNVAICEMSLGRYPDAIKTLDDISAIVRLHYGDKSRLYAMCLQNYGVYYDAVLDYNQVLNVSLEAAEIIKEVYGVSSEEYVKVLTNIGATYSNLGMYNSAEDVEKEAYNIALNFQNKESNNTYLGVISNLGSTYFSLGKYKVGQQLFQEALSIISKREHVDSSMAVLLAQIGKSLLGLYGVVGNTEQFASVIDIFAGALEILKTLDMLSSPLAQYCSLHYGLSCLMCEKKPTAEYPPLVVTILKRYYNGNFKLFTESDRIRIWNVLQNNKHLLFSLKDNVKMEKELYDYCLFSKSILLTTSTNFGKAVVSTGNKEIIAKYNYLKELKEQECSSNSRAKHQPASEVAKLEREITSMLKHDSCFIRNLNYTFEDVSSALAKNEVAIEFVDYTNLKTDKTEYIALILRSGWKEPKIIPLFEGDKLESFIKGSPKDMYSNSYAGSQLYELIWKPLSKYVHRGDTAYFSPSGKLYTIAIEALHTPNGQPLNQVYNMVRVSSTREVCIDKSTTLPKSAVIYGGLEYDITPSQMEEITRSMSLPSFEKAEFINDSQTRAGWGYLKGSKTEADYISKLMSNSHIEHKLYSGKMGNEESFKALSGVSPTLMHLATHGFFMANSDAKKHTFTSMLQSIGQPGKPQPQTIDPMQRAGLILAGGNNVWTGTEVSKNIEDGVLTASEISAMNLYGTDIVVLSACETGLGDISEDGVFGLQRAFKQAGVNTLIMSLWKVGDSATELMMKTFYKHLLDGKSKRESFALAQEAVRTHKDFADPYYWAAFIMLD